ncbi:MAG: ABC transporter ATP-binding protein [Deltaproteobacteria bacterium]|nr:ABC transporter ATP-binding protein [Deltaproteobacteria bacterium]
MNDHGTRNDSGRHAYMRLIAYLKPHSAGFIAAIACMVVLAGATGLYAYLVGPLLKYVFQGGRTGGEEFLRLLPIHLDLTTDIGRQRFALLLPVFLIVVGLIKGAAYFGQFFLMGITGQKIIKDLRKDLHDHMTGLSLSFYHTSAPGTLISRLTNDVRSVEGAVTTAVATVLRDSLQVITLVGLAFYIDWKLASAAFLVFPIAIWPIVGFGRLLKKVATMSQEELAFVADRLHELVSGIRVVQGFGQEEREKARFETINQRLYAVMRRSFAVRALQSPVMEFLGVAGLAAVIWYAGARVSSGDLLPERFISFFAAVFMLYQPVKGLGRVNHQMAEGWAGAERIFTLMDMEPDVKDSPSARHLTRFNDKVVFENVEFAYPGREPVLNGVNLSVKRGEVVAIVGRSGAGKTTIVDLIPRFYDVTGGRVMVDSVDVRDLTLSSLRRNIGLVTQHTVLFHDTVRVNVTYGKPDAKDDEIWNALERASAREFVDNLPQGLDTFIGEGGLMLSGGERQRLTIARALLVDPPILILDEATSALDSEAERCVQRAVLEAVKDRTAFVIAHRLSTVRNADKILVLNKGRIEESGTHNELLRLEGEYSKLYKAQFFKED